MQTAAALIPGITAQQPTFAALEIVPKITRAKPHAGDAHLLDLTATGITATTNVNVKIGGQACPEISALRTNTTIVCNRSMADAALLAVTSRPASCRQVMERSGGTAASGPYTIWPRGAGADPIRTYCEMNLAGGGW